jgi:hypothetical protein
VFVTLVHVRVKPAHVDDFIAATRRNHEASVQEAGNRRFDVLQSGDDATRYARLPHEYQPGDAGRCRGRRGGAGRVVTGTGHFGHRRRSSIKS